MELYEFIYIFGLIMMFILVLWLTIENDRLTTEINKYKYNYLCLPIDLGVI